MMMLTMDRRTANKSHQHTRHKHPTRTCAFVEKRAHTHTHSRSFVRFVVASGSARSGLFSWPDSTAAAAQRRVCGGCKKGCFVLPLARHNSNTLYVCMCERAHVVHTHTNAHTAQHNTFHMHKHGIITKQKACARTTPTQRRASEIF